MTSAIGCIAFLSVFAATSLATLCIQMEVNGVQFVEQMTDTLTVGWRGTALFLIAEHATVVVLTAPRAGCTVVLGAGNRLEPFGGLDGLHWAVRSLSLRTRLQAWRMLGFTETCIALALAFR